MHTRFPFARNSLDSKTWQARRRIGGAAMRAGSPGPMRGCQQLSRCVHGLCVCHVLKTRSHFGPRVNRQVVRTLRPGFRLAAAGQSSKPCDRSSGRSLLVAGPAQALGW